MQINSFFQTGKSGSRLPLHKMLPAAAAAVVICAAAPMLQTQELSAADLAKNIADARTADAQLTYTEDGAYFDDGSGRATGKFAVSPTYTVGDVDGDDTVNSIDASLILAACAYSGLGNSGDSIWQLALGEQNASAAAAQLHADVDADGSISSADASAVLAYAALSGTRQLDPMGTKYYYAGEDGLLRTGQIYDEQTGESYYAGEDYALVTGWVTLDEGVRLFDETGVQQKSCWAEDPQGGQVYLDVDGSVVTCWLLQGDSKYYLDEKGHPLTGFQSIDGSLYCFGTDGALVTGWIEEEGRKYHANTATGKFDVSFTAIDDVTYFFYRTDGSMATGWVQMDHGTLYFGEDGVMRKNCWEEIDGAYYYFNSVGVRQSGLLKQADGTYFTDENGVRQTGVISVDGVRYYFDPETGKGCAGEITDNYGTRRFDENGKEVIGWYTDEAGQKYYYNEYGYMVYNGTYQIDGTTYQFSESGVMITSSVYGVYGNADTNAMLNNAVRGDRKTAITVYNRQVEPEGIDFTLRLRDSDVENIEKFLAENTNDSMTLADKLYTVHQWIHYNVDYAYAGEKWNEIVNLTYTDAIFNHRKGQCVQYNGAMALTLAYFGFDVYMVRGWTSPGTQHYWTEVNLNGHTYMVECGNSGKNGDWWQKFFTLIE